MSLGKRLAILRDEAKVTQAELGAFLGVGHSTISNYESDYSKPDHETLVKLADFFHVSTDYLLCRTDRRYTLEPMTLQVEDGTTKTITYATDIPIDAAHLQALWADIAEQFNLIINSGALNEEQAQLWLENTKADLERTIKMIGSTKKDK